MELLTNGGLRFDGKTVNDLIMENIRKAVWYSIEEKIMKKRYFRYTSLLVIWQYFAYNRIRKEVILWYH